MTKISSRVRLSLIIIFVGLFTHSWFLPGGFKTMDDEASIVYNEEIKDMRNLGKQFTQSFFGGNAYYRPMVSASFMLEYQIAGAQPLVYNITNLFLHIVNAILIFWIVTKITERPRLAFFTGLLFAIHPIHVEGVSNIAGRAIILCAFFYFSAFLLYIKSQRTQSAFYCLLSMGSFILAMFTKETAITFMFIVMLYQYLWGEGRFLQRYKPALPFMILAIAYIILRQSFGIMNFHPWDTFNDVLLGVSTFLRGALSYLRILFLPIDLHFDRSIAYFQNFQSLEILLTLLVWGGLFTAFIANYRNINQETKFFLLWPVLTFLPMSQAIPIVAHHGFAALAEHFLYIPSLGPLTLVIASCSYFQSKPAVRRWVSKRVMKLSGVLLLSFFVITSIQANIESSQELVMFKKSLDYNDQNNRVRTSYALALAKRGLFKEAEDQFRLVLLTEPWNVRARIGLGKSLVDQLRYWPGLAEYEKVQSAGSLGALLNDNINKTLLLLEASYKTKLKETPADANLYYGLGIVYAKMGRTKEAIKQYIEAVDLYPEFQYALFNLASSYELLGKEKKAIEFYQRLIESPQDDAYLEQVAQQKIQTLQK